jgi:hypothetical protein
VRDSAADAAAQPSAHEHARRQQFVREHHDTLTALLDANTIRHPDRLDIAAGHVVAHGAVGDVTAGPAGRPAARRRSTASKCPRDAGRGPARRTS